MSSRPANRAAFTLVEIMIVVAIIGLLAAIAMPAWSRARTDSKNTTFIADLKVASAAFEQYAMEHGDFPPDAGPGVVPAGMAPYLTGMNWTAPTPLGGQWDWDYLTFANTISVSVWFNGQDKDALMQTIDQKIDDGNLATGNFRKRADGYYIYIIEQR